MNITRRRFLRFGGALVLPAWSHHASAQTYPARPVHIIVGFAAGGPTDTIARLIARSLSDRLGQPFIVENRAGAATNIATENVARAAPDGYTLLLINAANAINTALYPNPGFDFMRDIEPVAGISQNPLVFEINPSLPAKSVPEFIAYAKANPGKINFASGGVGAPNHLAAELFKAMAGVNMVHVPYRGEALAMTDLIGGQVHSLFGVITGSIEHMKAGKLRPLAVTSAERLGSLPDIPALREFIPGYEASQWYGIGAPRNTPVEVTKKLNAEINIALADAKLRASFEDLVSVPMPMSLGEFQKFTVVEIDKWAAVVKLSGLKAE